MNIETFLAHHGLTENPFDAEEARHDRVLERLIDSSASHPDFAKVLGRICPPGSSVVFGEKGSGKTAMRLMIERRVREHNQRAENTHQRTLLVAYDDWNPTLDRVLDRARSELSARKAAHTPIEKLLEDFRLEDHQDAMLSLAVTRTVDLALNRGQGPDGQVGKPSDWKSRIRKMPRRLRADLAVLAALYDQSTEAGASSRWRRLRSTLRLGWLSPVPLTRVGGTVLGVVGLVMLLIHYAADPNPWSWLMPLGALALAGAVVCLGLWTLRHLRLWRLCRRICHELAAVLRSPRELRLRLLELSSRDLQGRDWPLPGIDSRNSRYQLTARLLQVLHALGYGGIMVLVDRVDEPTVISGRADRMRSVIWPMLDNKFLQQQGVGLKLLLPIELRHLLYRESPEFFQEARLDKQHLVDRLNWSGAVLYDLCMNRLRACHNTENSPITLRDLFEPEVTGDMLIDALDQMHQPRDAFKFLYRLIQEHCQMTGEDQPRFEIARLTLEMVRRAQSQRVQEFYRGQSPA